MAAVSPGVYKKVLAVRQAYSFDIACLLMRFFGSMLNIGVVTMIAGAVLAVVLYWKGNKRP